MRRTALLPLVLGAAAVLPLAACGGPTGIELEHSKRAAEACASRLGTQVVAVPAGPGVGAAATPYYAAQVVGVSGDPPTALGYGDPSGQSAITFAVVPAAAKPSKSTTFADATDASAHATFLTVPARKAVAAERCLGGSATG